MESSLKSAFEGLGKEEEARGKDMSNPMIEVQGLSKNYGTISALKDVSFTVAEKEIVGLVGPDGAGKTTVLRLICSLIPPTGGGVNVLGMDAFEKREYLKNFLGYMPQRFSLYQDLTLTENLDFFSRVFGLDETERKSKINFFLELTGLKDHRNKLAGQLSGGMKQKLALAVNLIHRPKILLLDEPSTGVDPVARKEFWDVLQTMRKDGVTVMVATPYMEEAERCDRLVLLHQGKMLAEGTKEEIISIFPYHVIRVNSENPFSTRKELQALPGVQTVMIYGNSVHVITPCPDEVLNRIREGVKEPLSCQVASPSIEDSFIYLTERGEGGTPSGIRG